MAVEMDAGALLVENAERLLAQRFVRDADQCFARAERAGADPDRCAAGLWQCAMLRGDFEAAWRANDAIRARDAPDPHRFWQGEAVAGRRVMVRCLHGLGDSLQFLCYLPRLQEVAAHVTVEVAPRMVELARCLAGAVDVVTWGEGAPPVTPAYDLQVEVMELPYLFRTQLSELPVAEQYLQARAPALLPARTAGLRVGLVWTAGDWNAARALPAALLGPLLQAAGCEFWYLGTREPPVGMLVAEGARENLVTLAGVVLQMDVVITVDTLAAHLAGALGVRAWVMLQHAADWRWMDGRDDSPWYPSLRLFRQSVPGDWIGVVDWVAEALSTLAASSEFESRVEGRL